MYVLGLSCFFHDAAAALLKDGVLVAAASLHAAPARLQTVAPGQVNQLDAQRLGFVAADVGDDSDDRPRFRGAVVVHRLG